MNQQRRWRVLALAAAFIGASLLTGSPAASAVGHDKPSPRIIGGSQVADQQKYIVSIWGVPDKGQNHMCGGALIKPLWVITAAHCTGLGYGDAMRIGDNNRTRARIVRPDRVIVHPEHDRNTLANDIALLRIDPHHWETIKDKVKPIELQRHPSWETEPVKVYGWGVTSVDDKEGPEWLRAARSKVLPGTDCEWGGTNSLFHKDQMLCYSAMAEDGTAAHPCVLDSGSPVVHRDTGDHKQRLVGLVNAGHKDCRWGTAGFPWFGVSVHHYLAWIDMTTTVDDPAIPF